MPFNLLLLPLLGGYIFLRYWNPTRYHALRAEKERLVILAAIPGVFGLIIAFAGMRLGQYLFPCHPGGRCFQTWWINAVPFPYVGTALVALIIAGLAWIPLNRLRFCRRDPVIDRMIDQDGIPLDMLLRTAQDENKTVSVTMENDKVYVGWVTHIFNPAFPTLFIKLLPTKSGYRVAETKRVKFITFYSNALDKIERDFDSKVTQYFDKESELEALKETESNDESKVAELQAQIDSLFNELDLLATVADDFGIVLPVSKIQSVNIFSERIHAQYFAPTDDQPDSAPVVLSVAS